MSASVIILYIAPILLYLYSGNIVHIKALLGLTGTNIISEGIKYFLIGNKSPRPHGAKDCDLLCKDGNQEGRPGMPSSHSSTVTFFSSFYYHQTNNKFIQILLIIYAGLVMLSRYVKHCHTISQIITGSFLGLALSWFAVRHL